MGWVGLTVSGLGFGAMGLWQGYYCLVSAPPHPPSKPSRLSQHHHRPHCYIPPAFELLAVASMALAHIASGLFSSHREKSVGNPIGEAIPLERASVALFFLLYATVGLIREKFSFLSLPWEAVHLLGFLALGQEFLLFYLRRPDAGLEGRYFTLLLVPIMAGLLSTVAEISCPDSTLPALVRSASLVLQGNWMIQTAASVFSPAHIAKGCSLHADGDGDYLVECAKGMDLMRARAIATLQFNCHMALLLVALVPLYSLTTRHNQNYSHGNNNKASFSSSLLGPDATNYERLHGDSNPLEMKYFDRKHSSPFSLDLDDDDDDNRDEDHEEPSSYPPHSQLTANHFQPAYL